MDIDDVYLEYLTSLQEPGYSKLLQFIERYPEHREDLVFFEVARSMLIYFSHGKNEQVSSMQKGPEMVKQILAYRHRNAEATKQQLHAKSLRISESMKAAHKQRRNESEKRS